MQDMQQELGRLGYGGSCLARFSSLGEYMEDTPDGFDIRDRDSWISPENPRLSEDTLQVRNASEADLLRDQIGPATSFELAYAMKAPITANMAGGWAWYHDDAEVGDFWEMLLSGYEPPTEDTRIDDNGRWDHEADNFVAQQRANQMKEYRGWGELFTRTGKKVLGQNDKLRFRRGRLEREETAERILRWIDSAPVYTVRRSQNRFWQRLKASRAKCAGSGDWSGVWLKKEQVDAIAEAFKRRLKSKA